MAAVPAFDSQQLQQRKVMGYVLEVSNSKYPQKPAGLYHLLCDAYLDCGIDVLIFGIGLFIRCSCYGRKYVDADDWNFAYVSSGCFYVLVCDRLCDPLYAGTTEKRSLQPTN